MQMIWMRIPDERQKYKEQWIKSHCEWTKIYKFANLGNTPSRVTARIAKASVQSEDSVQMSGSEMESSLIPS